jgi:hypothetical protein
MLPSVAGMTGVHHSAFSVQMGSQELFHSGWLQTTILLFSASQIARITGVSHWVSGSFHNALYPSIQLTLTTYADSTITIQLSM